LRKKKVLGREGENGAVTKETVNWQIEREKIDDH